MLIASGPLPPNPAELLASDRMAKLIKDLAGMTDCLLIDTAPVLAVSDALAIARHADGVIVVARLGSVTKDQVREMRGVFERAGTRVIGAVATGTEKSPRLLWHSEATGTVRVRYRGGRSLAGAPAGRDHPQRPEQDAEIQAQGPIVQVVAVESYHVFEVQVAAP